MDRLNNKLKEILRMRNQTLRGVLAISFALGLMGCHGQNPFKFESNPIKDYPSANNQDGVTYVAGEKPEGLPDLELSSRFKELPSSVAFDAETISFLL